MSTVLIVDDHVLNRQFLTALLGFGGHRILSAADGVEALAVVAEEHPDLIVTDIMMPNMNGYEFVIRLRADSDSAVAATPVIFYTSTYSTREAKSMARRCGVRWVLQKPSPPELINATVNEALGVGAPASAEPSAAPVAPLTPAPARSLDAFDRQLATYLGELEASRQLLTQFASTGADSGREHLLGTARQLSQSLGDLQSVSLRLTALIDMGIEFAREREPQHLLETACRVARHIGVASYAVVGVVGEPGGPLRHLVTRGMEAETEQRIAKLALGEGLLGHVMRDSLARRRASQDARPSTLGLPLGHPPVQCVLAVPVSSGGRCYGWIYLADKIGAPEFTEVDERVLCTVATQLAVTLENLSLYDTVAQSVRQLESDLVERKRIADQLHESEERFRQLAENIVEVFFLIDPVARRILYISPAYEKIWGRSCTSLLHAPASWMSAVHPDDLSHVQQLVRAGLAGARQHDGNFDLQFRIVQGTATRWIHARGYPIHDEHGALVRIAGIAADTTQAMQLQASLREREAGLQQAQQVARMAHLVTRADGVFESWSATLPRLIGAQPGAMPCSIQQWIALVDPADRKLFREVCVGAAESGRRRELTYRLRRPDNGVIRVRQVLAPLAGQGEQAQLENGMRWLHTLQDVTEQQEQQLRIARLSQMYAVLSGINSAIVRIRERDELLQEACRVAVSQGPFSMAWAGVVDPASGEGKVVAWHGDAAGYIEHVRFTASDHGRYSRRPASVALREQRQVIYADVLQEPALAPLHAELAARGVRAMALLPLCVDQRAVAIIALFSDDVAFFNHSDKRKLLDELAGDLSFGLQFIEREERLSYLAYYDALTGLPNGMLFNDRLEQSLHAAAGGAQLVAAIMIDLERFAHLNDVLGRHTGDAVLKQFAARLDRQLPHDQREHLCLARIGGDVFAIAVSGIERSAEVAALLEKRILPALSQPFELAQQEMQIAARAGIALYPADGHNAETLFKHAELALKKAKSSGERYLYYAPQMNAALAQRVALEQALHVALAEGQFMLVYQPRVDLLSGRISSAEALIRWRHPARGLVGPGEFIALAEETGQILAIGDWVIDAVCAQLASWRDDGIELVPVAVNLSAVQFKKGGVHDIIRAALARHGVDQQWLEFELTESVVMDDPDTAVQSLQELKQMGAQLSLDDFGTGYSSLAYLKRFPFDFVKIDRAFVTDVTDNPDDAAIAIAIIAMAHSLGLRVVAEGVETEAQLTFLRRHRCDELQGYLFSRPVEAPSFAAMLREEQHLPIGSLPARREDTLLVVDCKAANRSAIRRLLRQQGYRVLTAKSGKEALELLALNPVQVILTEQDLPGMSGAALLALAGEHYPAVVGLLRDGAEPTAMVSSACGQAPEVLPRDCGDEVLRNTIQAAFSRYHAQA